MNNKVIWIFNHYASLLPTRHLELGKQFVKHGYTVVVFVSSFHHGTHEYIYDEKIKIEEMASNVFFVYLKTGPKYTKNDARRVLNFISYNRKVCKYEKDIVNRWGKPQYIIASSLHPLVWKIGNKFSKKYGAKWVAEVKDLWPLQLTDIMGLSKYNPAVLYFGKIEKKAYKQADAIVTSMPYADKYICDKLAFPKSKVHWIPNGISTESADEYLNDSNISIPSELEEYLKSHWCCVYCGSLVKSEQVPYLVEAFSKIKNHDDIYMAIIGSGHAKEDIEKTIKNLGLESKIRIFPRVEYNQIPKILNLAKCCLSAVGDYSLYKYGLSLIKHNDYLYSGKPTIFASNYSNVIEKVGDLAVSFGDPSLIADKICQVKEYNDEQLKALELAEKNIIRKEYDYMALGDRFLTILESS